MKLPVAVEVRDGSLESLVDKALEHLAELEYKPSSRDQYAKTWKRFLRFVRECGGDETRLTMLSEAFLEATAKKGQTYYRRRSGQLLAKRGMKVLTEFSVNGCFQIRAGLDERFKVSPSHRIALTDYLTFSEEHLQHREVTLKLRKRHVLRFLHYLHGRGIDVLKDIGGDAVSGFLASRTLVHPTSFAILVGSIRSFIRFLAMRGQVSTEVVAQLDELRIQRPRPVPSVWSREQVDALLGAVDRGSPTGKRDYAILILAAQLGIRSSDIRKLRLDSIIWEQSRIDFRQSKTDQPVSLPMSEEVGVALIDYLKHGRPCSSRPEVFLRAHAPFWPMRTVTNVITKYRSQAGIPLPPGRGRRGMHSLRHTLASQLLESSATLEVVAAVLGHRCQRSTRSYIRVDVESLRAVALELDEVSHDRA